MSPVRFLVVPHLVGWMSGLVTGLQNQLQRFESATDLSWSLSSVGSERLPYKQRVGGSNPSATTLFNRCVSSDFFCQYILRYFKTTIFDFLNKTNEIKQVHTWVERCGGRRGHQALPSILQLIARIEHLYKVTVSRDLSRDLMIRKYNEEFDPGSG